MGSSIGQLSNPSRLRGSKKEKEAFLDSKQYIAAVTVDCMSHYPDWIPVATDLRVETDVITFSPVTL